MSVVDQASAVDEPAAPVPVTPSGRTRWERPALAGLLLASAALHLWGLSASGWANSFYAAAVQAGSVSWRSFFFVAADAGNSISIDKTPLSIWVMALSARLFGMSSWSMLAPQAVMGVAATALVYATVRRWFTPAAALIAGAVLALTPVAVLMFRFNNPDALLTLLLIAAVYAVVRALEQASTRWVLLGGVLVGLAFSTKMLQAFLVVPALVSVYLVCAPTSVRRRLFQLLGAFAAMVVTGGWWVAAVELTPASARPYVGGSEHNSVLELILGFNGLGRLSGNEAGGPGGAEPVGQSRLPVGQSRCHRTESRTVMTRNVIDGLVKMANVTSEGKSTTFTGVPAGGWFGEGSLLKDEPRRYDIVAMRDTSVALMPRATFLRLLETSLAFNRYLLVQLNERLGQFIGMVETERFHDPEGRVARCLAMLYNPQLSPGIGARLEISQEEIGLLAGVSRQRVNQALQALEKAGLLQIEYGAVSILDLDGLRAFGG